MKLTQTTKTVFALLALLLLAEAASKFGVRESTAIGGKSPLTPY